MKIIVKSFATCAVIASGILLYTPAVSAIPIDFTVVSNGNTPEAAVANALRNPNNTGVCGSLRANEILSPGQAQILTLCDTLVRSLPGISSVMAPRAGMKMTTHHPAVRSHFLQASSQQPLISWLVVKH